MVLGLSTDLRLSPIQFGQAILIESPFIGGCDHRIKQCEASEKVVECVKFLLNRCAETEVHANLLREAYAVLSSSGMGGLPSTVKRAGWPNQALTSASP